MQELIDFVRKFDLEAEEENKQLHRSFVGKITPEWFYSDCLKMFEKSPINWVEIERLDHLITIANELPEFRLDTDYNDNFERTFSSWYQPYHYVPRTKWGIHVRRDSIQRIALKFYQKCPSLINNKLGSVTAASLYLTFHNLFHHMTENMVTAMEMIKMDPHIYRFYYSAIYAKYSHSELCLEELLANRYLLEMADDCSIDRSFLRKELQAQSYINDEDMTLSDSSFIETKKNLIRQISNDRAMLTNPNLDHILSYSHLSNYGRNDGLPIWLHHRPKPLR